MSVVVFLLEFLVLAEIRASGVDPVDNLTVCFFISAFTVAFLADISRSKRLKYCKVQLMLGYLFRLSLLFFDLYGQSIYHLPNSGADSDTFYFNAKWLSLGLPARRTDNFIILYKNIFKIIGTNRLFGQFIIVLFSLVSLCATAWIMNEIALPTKHKQRTMMLISILPNYALLGSIFLRESIVSMYVTLSLLFFIRYMNNKGVINLIPSTVFLLLGTLYHSGTIGLGVGYIIVVLLYDKKTKMNHLSFARIIASALLLVGLLYLYLNYGDLLFKKFGGINDVSDIANMSTYGRTSYVKYVGNSSSFGNVLLYSIPRIVFFLFSPFPWQWETIADIVGFFVSSLYYLLILYQVFSYLKQNKGSKRTLVFNVLIITMCMVFVFAWGVSNSGTACRHRDKTATLFALMYALTLSPTQQRAYYIGKVRLL